MTKQKKNVPKYYLTFVGIFLVIFIMSFVFRQKPSTQSTQAKQEEGFIVYDWSSVSADEYSDIFFTKEEIKDKILENNEYNKLKNYIGTIKKYSTGEVSLDNEQTRKDLVEGLYYLKAEISSLNGHYISRMDKENNHTTKRPIRNKKSITNINKIMEEWEIEKIYNDIVEYYHNEFEQKFGEKLLIESDMMSKAQEYSQKTEKYVENHKDIIDKIKKIRNNKDYGWINENAEIGANLKKIEISYYSPKDDFLESAISLQWFNNYLKPADKIKKLSIEEIEEEMLSKSGWDLNKEEPILKVSYEEMSKQNKMKEIMYKINDNDWHNKEVKELYKKYAKNPEFLTKQIEKKEYIKGAVNNICSRVGGNKNIENFIKYQYFKTVFGCDNIDGQKESKFIKENKEKILSELEKIKIHEPDFGREDFESQDFPNQFLISFKNNLFRKIENM